MINLDSFEQIASEVFDESNAFEYIKIGFAGNYSKKHIAFMKMLESKGAKLFFKNLYKSSSKAGKLYAIAGLFLVDNKNYNLLVGTEEFKKDAKSHIEFSCMGEAINMIEFIKLIDNKSLYKSLGMDYKKYMAD